TTHDDPVYTVHDVIHYAVGNIPGAVPHTSTYALTNATLPYVHAVAERGVRGAVERDPALLGGLTTVRGHVVNPIVADAMGAPAHTLQETLGDVERALEKIADGTYGTCENCGKQIAGPRLEAMPAARLCIDCASNR